MEQTQDTPRAAAARCASCGSALAPGDEFCTHCGAHVEPAPGTTGPATVVEQPRRLRRWPWVAVVALALGAALAAAVVAGRYRSDLDAAESALVASEQQVAELRAANERLAAALETSKQLSARRAAVLRRAGDVLAGIDPVLSSVDELKRLTAGIQAARDDFLGASSDAITAVLDLQDRTIELWNYTIDAGEDADATTIDSAVDDLNRRLDDARAKIATARRYADRLSDNDDAYTRAATTFDTRASSLSQQVEALRRQLKAIVTG